MVATKTKPAVTKSAAQPSRTDLPSLIDVDQLRQGDVIPESLLLKLTGEKRGTTIHQRKVAAIQCELQKLLMASGKMWVVRFRRGNIEILTDEAATKHLNRRLGGGRRAIIRRSALLVCVDQTKLTTGEQAKHARRLMKWGHNAAGMFYPKPSLEPAAYQRSTPVLPST